MTGVTRDLTDEQWATIDEALFANKKLSVVMQLRTLTGLDLHDAVEMMYARYEKLRAEHPAQFCCGHDEYWEHFYS